MENFRGGLTKCSVWLFIRTLLKRTYQLPDAFAQQTLLKNNKALVFTYSYALRAKSQPTDLAQGPPANWPDITNIMLGKS